MSKARLTSTISAEALSRIDSRDMLILQSTSGKVMSDLAQFHSTDQATGMQLEVSSRESLEAAYGFSPRDEDERKPFVYQDGIAVIPVHGTLLNRFNGAWGFVTGFQYVRRMLNAALDDDDVEVIVFDVDSPGGEAAGCFELCREILASRRVKPSLAMVDSTAASGGMAIAACATVLYAIPSARIGSIGVYRMHVSYEEALAKSGIKVTFAQAGDRKTDGNPYKDLPEAVLNEWTESAKKTWDDFISLVAEARDISEDDVRDTQAQIYRADEALAKGLINAVKTPTEAVAAFLAELADDDPSNDEEEEIEMANEKKEATSGLSAADLEKIGAIAAQAAAGVVSAAMGGMQRAQEIKDYAASKGKQFAALASTLVKNDALTAEDAIAIIDAAAGDSTAAPKKAAKPKKGQRAAEPDEDDEGDDDGIDDIDEDADDADDDADEDEDDDGEEAADAARRRRMKGKDKVNHFGKAMSRSKHPNAGGGRVKSEDASGGKPKGGSALLAAHASVTGADWSRKALEGAKH